MIAVKFEEKEKIGLQYALETLHGCSPFGQERIRRLRFYAPEERAALEEELYNVEQAANAAAATQPAQAAANGAPQPLDEVKGEQGQDEMDKSFDEILRIFNKDKF